MLLDPDNAFRYLEVRGVVTSISPEGGDGGAQPPCHSDQREESGVRDLLA